MAELEKVEGDWWLCDGHPDLPPFYCAHRHRMPECIPVPVYRVKASESAVQTQTGAALSDVPQSGPYAFGSPEVGGVMPAGGSTTWPESSK